MIQQEDLHDGKIYMARPWSGTPIHELDDGTVCGPIVCHLDGYYCAACKAYVHDDAIPLVVSDEALWNSPPQEKERMS